MGLEVIGQHSTWQVTRILQRSLSLDPCLAVDRFTEKHKSNVQLVLAEHPGKWYLPAEKQ